MGYLKSAAKDNFDPANSAAKSVSQDHETLSMMMLDQFMNKAMAAIPGSLARVLRNPDNGYYCLEFGITNTNNARAQNLYNEFHADMEQALESFKKEEENTTGIKPDIGLSETMLISKSMAHYVSVLSALSRKRGFGWEDPVRSKKEGFRWSLRDIDMMANLEKTDTTMTAPVDLGQPRVWLN